MIAVLMTLFLVVTPLAKRPPDFCQSIDYAEQSGKQTDWTDVSRAFWVIPSQNQFRCYPPRHQMQPSDENVSWSLQGSAWRIRPQGGQLSYIDGQIRLVSADQTLAAEQAWLWRSEDGGIDKICMPTQTTWKQSTWHVQTAGLLHQADSEQTVARENVFVLYGENDQPLYGYSNTIRANGADQVQLQDIHATVCPLDDRVWSVSAESLDWSGDRQVATFKNVRFYWYDIPFYYLSQWRVGVGKGRDPYGWQSPKYGSYYQDPLVVGRPYRMRSTVLREFTPWFGLTNSLSGSYYQAAQSKRYRYQLMIRSGLHRVSPRLRYGLIYRGHLDEIFGADSLDIDLVNMRDGMYAQYFSPRFFKRTSPNMPLPSSLVYRRQTPHLFSQLSVVTYQKFTGPMSLANAIGVPRLNILPRLETAYGRGGLTYETHSENLVTDSTNNAYPDTQRTIQYAGYSGKLTPNLDVQLGGWFKHQLVGHDGSWVNLNTRHTFGVPNFAGHYTMLVKRPVNLTLAYAYTGYVDQQNDPLFQHKWQWLGDEWDYKKLISVDRIYDRNRLWLILQRQGLFSWTSADLNWRHIFDFKTPQVSVSNNGAEDPLRAHPRGVSVIRLNDEKRRLKSRWVVVWPTQSIDYYSIDWSSARWRFNMSRVADTVTVENQIASVPKVSRFKSRYSMYKTDVSTFDAGIQHTSGLNHRMMYHLNWTEDRCCWQGGASIRLTRWYNDDDPNTNVFSGWQPSASIRFSLKGLSNTY